MNKKFIAAAIAAALAAPMAAAHADVTVYGKASLEYSSVDLGNGLGSGGAIEDAFGNSRVGVKWSEDLGGGLMALGEMEWNPASHPKSMDNSAGSAPTGRQQYLGIKGGFGEIQVGTVLQPYKYSGGVAYDAFVATAAQARDSGGMAGGAFGQDGFFTNAIAYKKKFGMAQIWLAYSPEGNGAGNANPTATPPVLPVSGGLGDSSKSGAKGDLMASVVVGIQNGQVGVAYAHQSHANGTTGADGVKNTKIFGKYSFGNNTILAQYEDSKAPVTGNATKYAFLGYQLKLPAMNLLVVQLGQEKPDGANKTNYTALGVVHHFSKKTDVYAAYRKSKQDGGTDIKGWAVGITEAF